MSRIKRGLVSSKGAVVMLMVMAIAGASAIYLSYSGQLLRFAGKQKKHGQIKYYDYVLVRGIFDYTVNAIKERWCMSESWDRDLSCNFNDMNFLLNIKGILKGYYGRLLP